MTRTDLHRCYSPISFTVIRRASAGQVPAADSEALSQVIASGHEGLTRVLVAGDEVLSVVISGM
ncbi:hypothetical protein F9J28_19520 [Escherichia coli]|nr:hypothetical protein [Escherichia coli]EFE7516738.1 hypothetical protein [Escherichia coli]EFH9770757.1 hypothetical protein [Escherichia coli]